jgi:hypothetical protein
MFHLLVLLILKSVKTLLIVFLAVIFIQVGSLALAEENTYVPYSQIIKGKQGVNPLQLIIFNDTGLSMTCTAMLAHWFSVDLGKAKPGEHLEHVIWHNPKTGVINLMNQTNDRMPLEAIWCGAILDLSATRTRIPLPIFAGTVPLRIIRICHTKNGRWKCNQTAD